MRNSILCLFALLIIITSCNKEEEPIVENTNGYNMLLMGNSFFRPYAEKLDVIAIDAGFENHNSNTVFRGGENGRPINFWNDSTSLEHNEIKAILDQGNIEIFGMTLGHDSINPTEGHKAWIEYALQNNPEITIFISLSPPDFPADWEQLAQDLGFNSIQEAYGNYINETFHPSFVEELRAEFPSTNIFTIPTGWATINLAQMNLDNGLLDEITMSGPVETSIFTDEKGHQGEIVRETGGLVWLNSIYNVDLSTYTYETGFITDLHTIAEEIMNSHDDDYKK